MKDFVFFTKSEPVMKAILRVDTIDKKAETCTIMWMGGFDGTIFERYMPWQLGDVVLEDEIKDLFAKFQPELNGAVFSKNTPAVILGTTEHTLTITPSITNGSAASVIVSCENDLGVGFKKLISLEDGKTATMKLIKGFEYSFKTVGNDTWTGDEPDSIVCDGNEAVSLQISIPIDLPTHEMTITPTLTDATTTSVKMKGTKAGFTSTEETIALETSVDKVVEIYEGYSYVFEVIGNDTWTGGSAPAAIVCDGDETAALAITVVA